MKNLRGHARLYPFLMFIVLTTLPAPLPQAMVIVPVADLLHRPMIEYTDAVQDAYNAIPYAEVSVLEQCDRAYQLLFNEQVGIVAYKGEEVLVAVPHVFYKRNRESIPETVYWTLKKNILPLEDLEQYGIDAQSVIPQPIKRTMTSLHECNKNTIALIFPFYDPITKQTYSTGTRFLLASQQELSPDTEYFTVKLLDTTTMTVVTTTIPAAYVTYYEEKEPHERIQDFVQLIRKWAQLPQGVIPYVWGGASFTHAVPKDNFGIEKRIKANGTVTNVFIQHGMHTVPHTGFDCSCMISRAAQLCGIPYYLGNSWTIEYAFSPLEEGQTLQTGDIIWFPGHVVLVGNTDPRACTTLEARGYGSGFGRLHELPLSAMFKDMTTFEQLTQAYNAQKPLLLLNSKGGIRAVLSTFKLFKMNQIWEEPLLNLNKKNDMF